MVIRRLLGHLVVGGAVCLCACGGGAAAQKGAASPPDSSAASSARQDLVPAWRARRVPHPDSVRALYVNAWAAGSRTRMRDLIRIADATEINAFVIDVKESDTYLAYTGTVIPLAREIGADKRPATNWMPELLDTLHAHQIYPIARIVVFKDRMLAERKPEFAIRHVNGGVWRDNKGGAWVNPYDHRVWDYNIAIAREALEMGFSELQWDYVRFPDVTARMRTVMTYPGSNNVPHAENIRDFILYSKEQLRAFEAPVTADVFGLVTHLDDDVGIGQNWEKVITAADAVLPMTYPSPSGRPMADCRRSSGADGSRRRTPCPVSSSRESCSDAIGRPATPSPGNDAVHKPSRQHQLTQLVAKSTAGVKHALPPRHALLIREVVEVLPVGNLAARQ